jgi:death-on-curing protein
MVGISNLSLVESAIDRPYTGYYRRIESKAGARVESVAGNHGFVDGNKRTSLLLLLTLLERSGYRLAPANSRETMNRAAEQMILDVVCHQLDFEGLVSWFKLRIRRHS